MLLAELKSLGDMKRLLVSEENLGFVRSVSEVDLLVQMIPANSWRVVYCWRDPSELSTSWLAWLASNGLSLPQRIIHRDSTREASPNSWLWDFEALSAPWTKVLGKEAVQEVHYANTTTMAGPLLRRMWKACLLPDVEFAGDVLRTVNSARGGRLPVTVQGWELRNSVARELVDIAELLLEETNMVALRERIIRSASAVAGPNRDYLGLGCVDDSACATKQSFTVRQDAGRGLVKTGACAACPIQWIS